MRIAVVSSIKFKIVVFEVLFFLIIWQLRAIFPFVFDYQT